MKTILVPTDYSAAADNAIEYAAHLSQEMHASIVLLHVFHMPLIDPLVTSYVITYDDVEKCMKKS